MFSKIKWKSVTAVDKQSTVQLSRLRNGDAEDVYKFLTENACMLRAYDDNGYHKLKSKKEVRTWISKHTGRQYLKLAILRNGKFHGIMLFKQSKKWSHKVYELYFWVSIESLSSEISSDLFPKIINLAKDEIFKHKAIKEIVLRSAKKDKIRMEFYGLIPGLIRQKKKADKKFIFFAFHKNNK